MSTRPEDTASAPLHGAFFAVLALVGVAVLAPRVAGFTTDSDAYLDVAMSLRDGNGFVQSVVDFWRPAVPDPLGLWPPLYPALIAAVAAFGVPLELAARLVAAASFAGFAFAFHALAVSALGRGAGALATVAALATPAVLRLGASAWSEAPYLALTTGGLALLARADARDNWSRRAASAAGALLGAAALTRYVGVPIVVAAVVFVATRRELRARGLLSFAAPALILPGLWLGHNLLEFGRPFGPALAPAAHGMGKQAFEFLRALRWELFPAPFDHAAPGAYALALVTAGGVWLALRGAGAGRIAAAYALLHAGLVVVATATSGINSPTGRYLAPVLPFLVLAAFTGWRGRGDSRRVLATALAAVWTLAVVVELLGQVRGESTGSRDALARRADLHALARIVPVAASPVLSDCGHLVRVATGRTAVQIPAPAYRPRDYAAADDARWAAAGVNEAVFLGAGPPAGAWKRAAVEGRFTRWVRAGGMR